MRGKSEISFEIFANFVDFIAFNINLLSDSIYYVIFSNL